MVIIAVVLTLAICLLADWWLQRRERAGAAVPSPSTRPRPLPALDPPAHAGGFRLQEEMAYHPGHAWAFVEGPDQVRIGVDDFARCLLGGIDGIELPAVGTRLQQGQQAWTLRRTDRRAPMLSPLSGRVVQVNPRLLEDPQLAHADPYGEGWLMLVRADALRANLNNLLSGRLVRHWLEDVSARLRVILHGDRGAGIGFSFPDGGTAVEDIGSLLSDEKWDDAIREFLLTDP
ncbi:MAG: glycine cleavage system protein H [Gemmatimonadetes bacterium]|jgi:glycine cleavage system H protein|nr:glycine cleavage system protein H [Gemmatimonadota bacterium]